MPPPSLEIGSLSPPPQELLQDNDISKHGNAPIAGMIAGALLAAIVALGCCSAAACVKFALLNGSGDNRRQTKSSAIRAACYKAPSLLSYDDPIEIASMLRRFNPVHEDIALIDGSSLSLPVEKKKNEESLQQDQQH